MLDDVSLIVFRDLVVVIKVVQSTAVMVVPPTSLSVLVWFV